LARKKYIKSADSKAALTTFTLNTDTATVYPDFSIQATINAINNDPVARGAFNHFVDKCMEGNINIIKRDSRKLDHDELERLQSKFKYRTEILRKTFALLFLNNNTFTEIVKDMNDTKSLNVLDTDNVNPITEPNGDPIKYKSKVPHPITGNYAEWTKEEIVWTKLGDISKGWAPIDIRALWENLLTKSYVMRYTAWLWKTGQYRILYNFKNSSKQNVQDFLTYARKTENNFKLPFIANGDMETKILRDMKETDSITLLLKYLDSQTLILMRVPPIDAGIPDASGRSNADAQSNNLVTRIHSVKTVVADSHNYDLFPKINKKNNLLVFGPSDRFHEKQVFETVQMMQSMTMTPEVMQEYFESKGIYFKATMFKKEEPMETGNPRDKDMAPSRLGKGAGESEEVVGTGKESTTREDQL